LHINSRGGDALAAQAIYCVLADFNPRKIAYIGSVAAGTSTLIMCACDDIIAGHDSSLIVCQPWAVAIGHAETMHKAADDLEAITVPIVSVFIYTEDGLSGSQRRPQANLLPRPLIGIGGAGVTRAVK
jgi:ATP-dependent protease ClpP protease subunit